MVVGEADERQERRYSSGEINRELTTLKGILNLARQNGKLMHVPHVPMLKEQNVRTGFLEREQIERISVKLAVHGHLSDARQPSVTVAIFGTSDSSWGESTLTWTNRSVADTVPLGTIVVSGTTPDWYTLDLTTYLQARRAGGATEATLILKGVTDSLPYAWFDSRGTSDGPRLIVAGETQ
jgi:hypothetical protein